MSAQDASTSPFEGWLAALDERHLADLTPSELARALRALSSCYVERRSRLTSGAALETAGKRAAFALFYGPQHFLVAREISRALSSDVPTAARPYMRVVDLGCGTGAAGAAVALETNVPTVLAFDISRWAVTEAAWTYRHFGLNARTVVANLRAVRVDSAPGSLILAAYAINELDEVTREAVLTRLLEAHERGAALLIIEPIARRMSPWWSAWARTFVATGAREDEWRFRILLPPRQRLLGKAAGLDVQELTARSLLLPSSTRFRSVKVAG